MYVITGATGNIGSKLAGILLSWRQSVRVVGRSPEKLQGIAHGGAETAVGDLQDTEFLTKVSSGASAVFAMIPPHYIEEFADFFAKVYFSRKERRGTGKKEG